MRRVLYSSAKTNAIPVKNQFSVRRRCLVYVTSCLATAFFVHLYDRSTMTKRLVSIRFDGILSDPDPEAPWPMIAWLMSFPNSGTTYTAKLILAVTNTTTATNYGLESTVKTGIPVHGANGPFLLEPSLKLPKKYILTKTHCGGRCTECSPNAYVETVHSFEHMCRSGSKEVDGEKVGAAYDDPVQRVVHLVRSPFDNLVSRLHFERKKWTYSGKHPKFLENFTDSKEGLAAWCRYIDDLRIKEENESHFLYPELLEQEKAVPCHAEFYRYIQWHNLAFEVARRKRLPTHVLFYENFTYNFDETVAQLLNFLELSAMAPAPVFYNHKQYADYFEPQQYRAIARFVQELASPESWTALAHYVRPWL